MEIKIETETECEREIVEREGSIERGDERERKAERGERSSRERFCLTREFFNFNEGKIVNLYIVLQYTRGYANRKGRSVK